MYRKPIALTGMILLLISFSACGPKEVDNEENTEESQALVMGVDLSYLNQIMDKGGIYPNQQDPYQLFADQGAQVARLRLWHHPDWIRQVYENDQEKLYSGLADVKVAAQKIIDAGMEFCLDFHYSDNWADPGKQVTPAAWQGLNLELLVDSIHEYTYQTLSELKMAGLNPSYVQIGNEINSGILHPLGHYEMNNWKNLGRLVNAGIRAVNELYGEEDRPEIIIHIAQPENLRWFFNGLTISGEVQDFDIIGVSYYPVWSEVPLESLAGYLQTARIDFGKDIMIMEAAFPWTNDGADDYTNLIGGMDSLAGYSVTPQGQLDFMTDLCQEVVHAGGRGVFYWEPGWITSSMKTQWGTGSAWENCSFFDFNNNNSLLPVVQYLTIPYQQP